MNKLNNNGFCELCEHGNPPSICIICNYSEVPPVVEMFPSERSILQQKLKKDDNFLGLWQINLELTSLCNKNCYMCGRRKIEKEYPALLSNYGNIDFQLLKNISTILPPHIVVSFHNNGEPTLYPRLKEALQLFPNNIRHFDTNGKLLVEKADEIINNLETLTLSTFIGDQEDGEQYLILKEFLKIKGERKPNVVVRLLGIQNDQAKIERYQKLGIKIFAKRLLHSPMGSNNYEKDPTIPEIGFCLEAFSKLSIDRYGNVRPCVRFDCHNENILGNLYENTLIEIWNSDKRKELVKKHIEGKREEIKFCSKCHFWGVPTGY